MLPSNRRVVIILAFGVLLRASAAAALDWPMYGRDLKHSFTNAGSLINAGNVALLLPAWDFPTSDTVSASPTVVDGRVYVGAWDGFFYALDSASGSLVWSFQVDCDSNITPIPPQCPGGPTPPQDRVETDGGLITSSAAVVKGKVYFGAGKTVYCLNAADGSLVWKKVICGNPEAPNCESDPNDPNQIFSSPAVFKNRVFVGASTDGRAIGYRGGIVALDTRTGKQRWRFEVDPVLDANGKPVRVHGKVLGQNRSCGNVWSSGAVDEKKHLVYFGTADCGADAPPPYHEAVLALRTGSGRVRWAYRPRQGDVCDFDFGASANVIDLGANRWLGVGGKDGTYYVRRVCRRLHRLDCLRRPAGLRRHGPGRLRRPAVRPERPARHPRPAADHARLRPDRTHGRVGAERAPRLRGVLGGERRGVRRRAHPAVTARLRCCERHAAPGVHHAGVGQLERGDRGRHAVRRLRELVRRERRRRARLAVAVAGERGAVSR